MRNLGIFKKAITSWNRNDPFSQSAAIAFYTIFSFPALMLIYLYIASLFSNKENMQSRLTSFLQNIVGQARANDILSIIENSAPAYTSPFAAVIGIGVLLIAGMRLFLQLQKSLNMIWRVKAPEHIGATELIKQRLLSLGVMFVVGFIILLSILSTTLLTVLGEYVISNISEGLVVIIRIAGYIISFLTISILFATLLKLLPDIYVDIRYAAIGGLVSTLLFSIGQYALNLYFALAEPGSAYGVTGSIILLMLWVSYSCVILLFGAELTKVLQDSEDLKNNQ